MARESLCAEDTITYAVQVGGKLRATFDAAAGTPGADPERLALEQPNVQRHIEGKQVRTVIVVPRKMVSIVV